METAKTIAEIRDLVSSARRDGKRIGFVPTMGALHAGHLSLVDRARQSCQFVVVSIFVNPIQFGLTEDLSKYPRTEQSDLAACRDRGADVVFLPTVETMYPPVGRVTNVSVDKLSRNLCGASRPGHFDGVCTVVAKLFNIVLPDEAFFGAKDFQQAAIIGRMVDDLNFPIKVVVCPTVRHADGLAMSSRNVYLSAEQRAQAPALRRSLLNARDMILSSRRPAGDVVVAIKSTLAADAPAGVVDYIKIVDAATLEDVAVADKGVLIALAVKFSSARLIDNILVE